MFLVIPVSKTDNKIIDDFCELTACLGPYKNHKVLYVYKKRDKSLVDKIKYFFKDLFFEEYDCIIDKNCPSGWPGGPNFFWRQAILFLKKIDNKLPWYWMEIDVTPVKKKWLDYLEKEYVFFGKPFMGFIASHSNNYFRHLSGCAVYPADIDIYMNEWKWIHNCNEAFDLICGSRDKVLTNTAFTKSMLNLFRSKNFKIDDNKLFYDHQYFPFEFGLDDDLKMQEFSENTLVVHGCKDASLIKIIKKYYNI